MQLLWFNELCAVARSIRCIALSNSDRSAEDGYVFILYLVFFKWASHAVPKLDLTSVLFPCHMVYFDRYPEVYPVGIPNG